MSAEWIADILLLFIVLMLYGIGKALDHLSHSVTEAVSALIKEMRELSFPAKPKQTKEK